MSSIYALMPTADQIEQWARFNKNAEHDLAALIQQLVTRTASPTRCDIPVGKATNQSGADGLITSPGNGFCPAGESVWEWGVPEPSAKANSDYNDRTENTDKATRMKSTFVFVTPWKWARSRDWEKEKRDKGKWRDVKVLDSSDLVAWLATDNQANLWLGERINGPLAGEVRTLESAWRQWAEEFWPPAAALPELILAGRAAEADVARSWIGSAGFYYFRAASPVEGAAFVAAALLSSDSHKMALGQAAVVESESAWIQLVSILRQPMTLIPMFEHPPMLKQAVDNGHAVVLILPLNTRGEFEFTLPNPAEDDLVPVLMMMGADTAKAGNIAKNSRGSMTALARMLSTRTLTPRWPNAGMSRLIAPAAAAGRWNESLPEDRAALSHLAGIDYSDLRAGLAELLEGDDPPVRLVGSVWTATSQLDGLRENARNIASTSWDALEAVLVDVIGAEDPAWDLPADERWMANVKGKVRPHSDGLRGGLAKTLAIVATQPEFERLPGEVAGRDLAARVVRKLLAAANDDRTGRRWADLEPFLAVLAESAPNIFLDEVQRGLEGGEPELAKLMIEEPGPLFPRSRVSGLLWALERLAWSADYLSAVVVTLARLAAIDPGGRAGNRPASSLADVLMPWHPQTSADRSARLAAIKAARQIAPDAVWALLVRMLPRRSDIGRSTSRPDWQAWAPAEDPTVLVSDYWASIEDVVTLLLADAGTEASRWRDLIESYDDLPPEFAERVLAALNALKPDAFNATSLELMSNAISDLASRHRAHSDAQWAMPEDRIAALEAAAARLAPEDPVIGNAWLFDAHPSTQRISGRDYRSYDERLRDMRQSATTEIYEALTWTGIEELVAQAKVPYTVGATILSLDDDANESILVWAESDDAARIEALMGYLWARNRRDGWTWSEGYLRTIAIKVPHDRLASLVLGASRDKDAWELVEELGTDVERAYWSNFAGYPDGDALWVAARKLAEFSRPFAAIQIIATNITVRSSDRFDPTIAFEVLDAAASSTTQPLPQDVNGIDHDVAEVIKAIDAHGYDAKDLAAIEWTFLRVLENQPEALKHIYRRLADEPEFFVEMIKAVFRGEGEEPPEEPDTELRRLAEHAFILVHNWRGPIPGTRGDGTIDAAMLGAWVNRARELLAAGGRAVIGAQRIGHALWYAPSGADGHHPVEAVRDLIERVASRELETGYRIEAFNSRGVVARIRGGTQERDLAAHYAELARVFRAEWPRTAGTYRVLEEEYRSVARWEDQREELD